MVDTQNCRKKLEHLERYSRDYNIRVIVVDKQNGEDCMAIVLNYVNLLGLEDASAEPENADRTGRKQGDKTRHIIAKLYSRPFKSTLLQTAKSVNEKKKCSKRVKIRGKFIPSDFSTGKKAFPLMRKAFLCGRKCCSCSVELNTESNLISHK